MGRDINAHHTVQVDGFKDGYIRWVHRVNAQAELRNPTIIKSRSPENYSREKRKKTDFIILHNTSTSFDKWRCDLNDIKAKGSSNYMIRPDGKIDKVIDADRVAHHAGISMWNGRKSLNKISVGIEVCGPFGKSCTKAQERSLRWLVKKLKNEYNIPDYRVLPHGVVSYQRNKKTGARERGRKGIDGLQFANPEYRRNALAIGPMPKIDPDVVSGKLKAPYTSFSLFFPNQKHTKSVYTVQHGKRNTTYIAKAVIPASFRVQRGQVTFNVEGEENRRSPFFSRRAAVPSNSSGVTIGRGYDMKHKSPELIKADMLYAGIPLRHIALFMKCSGLWGDAARAAIKRLHLPIISPLAQKRLFEREYAQVEKDVIRICSKASVIKKYGAVAWDRLHEKLKELVIDLRFRGDYTPRTRRLLQKEIAQNDVEGALHVVKSSAFKRATWSAPRTRRAARIAMLENAV